MINKELKKLSRAELVDIIYQLKKNEQEMQDEIEALKKELEDKRLHISNAGSIADAAMSVTNLFSTAQITADIYLREIANMKQETEKECAKKINDAKKKVNEVIADGEKKFANLKAYYKNEYTRWQKLQCEIVELERKKKQILGEDVNNG